MTECAPSPPVRSLIAGDAVVAAFGDDVGGAVLQGELLPGLVPAHRDDPFGAELLGGQDAEEPDRAVADHGDGLARADLRRPRRRTSRCRARRRRRAGSGPGRRRACRAWRPGCRRPAGPACVRPGRRRARRTPGDAGGLVAGPADLAGVVRGEERADHELARPDVVTADPTSSTMPAYSWPIGRGPSSASIPRYGHRSEPQTQVAASRMMASVGSTIAGSGAVLDADLTGGGHDSNTHE